MSFFCSSSSSTRTRSLISKVAVPNQFFSFLYPLESVCLGNIRYRMRHQEQPVSMQMGWEDWFITSLASAGSCRKHAPKLAQSAVEFTRRRPAVIGKGKRGYSATFCRLQHTDRTIVEFAGRDPDSERARQERILELEEREFLEEGYQNGGLEWEKQRMNWQDASQPHDQGPYPAHDSRIHANNDDSSQPKTALVQTLSKEALVALVDEYSGSTFTDQPPLLELPNRYQPSDGPYLTVSDKVEDEWPPPNCQWHGNPETRAQVSDLSATLKDRSRDPEDIYQLYRALPAPRAPYLDAKTRHRLLRHLSIVERKDEQSMLRYFSVVDDLKKAAIPLSVNEWTSAISFASRYVSYSTEEEVEAALHLWREMEHVAGVRGNEATFNVLFDVACKAGKFTLAEMIYKEMEDRRLPCNRYHHVSLIAYYGLKLNGDGARAAYKELVNSNEIVDTVVLNAMISALIKSHEVSAAENIFIRMKQSHLEQSGRNLPPTNFRKARRFTQTLMRLSRLPRNHTSRGTALQNLSIIAPNQTTFRILVSHFATTAGDLKKVTELLSEMKWFGFPLHEAIFVFLLKGFAFHGGITYTDWTSHRLENVWASLLKAVDKKTGDIIFSRSLAQWAVRAFAKCSGKDRALAVWAEIQERWEPDPMDYHFVMGTVQKVIRWEALPETRSWIMGA